MPTEPAGTLPAEIERLFDRLENYYDFQCEGGPLKNCLEWQQLRAAYAAGQAAPKRHRCLHCEQSIATFRCVKHHYRNPDVYPTVWCPGSGANADADDLLASSPRPSGEDR